MKLKIVGILILSIAGILCLILFVGRFAKTESEHTEKYSPNKQFHLKTRYEDHAIIYIDIFDDNDHIWTINTKASGRSKWHVSWMNASTILLQSSDIGVRHWVFKGGEFVSVD